MRAKAELLPQTVERKGAFKIVFSLKKAKNVSALREERSCKNSTLIGSFLFCKGKVVVLIIVNQRATKVLLKTIYLLLVLAH